MNPQPVSFTVTLGAPVPQLTSKLNHSKIMFLILLTLCIIQPKAKYAEGRVKHYYSLNLRYCMLSGGAQHPLYTRTGK